MALSLAGQSALAETGDAARIARGSYLARVMDCGGCHTPRGPDGAPIPGKSLTGGSIGFEIPDLGIFWPPNLTPDATGLGGWTEAEVVTAIRTGERPDGRILAPAMPWPSFAGLTDEDATALAAFLLSLPPVENTVPAPATAGGEAPAPFYRVVLPKD
ncbi:MAG: c-type cytochrome [Rhodobacteraceae bacterium]|nr:c-type cytochrome [Paracoccaceae bacterium]